MTDLWYVVVVSWLIVVSAIALLGIKIWHWMDVNEDWRTVKPMDPCSAVYETAHGAWRLAWLRLMDGVCWLVLAIVMLKADLPLLAVDTQARLLVRLVILLMVWIEMAKLFTDRVTRSRVWNSLEEERQRLINSKVP